MTIAVIELNDTGIRLSVAGKILTTTPGYAIITPETVLLGDEARQQARIHPLQTNNQFWHQLNLDPLPVDNNHVRHNADLAYNQLSEIHQRNDFDEVVFAVPGHVNNEQLSLLLGIAQECQFTTVAIVDSAVAAVAPYAPKGRYIHLDTQLHQSVATLIQVDEEVSQQSVDVIPGIGLLAFYDNWAKLISDNFIRQTRFDPLHGAATEQQLYNQLPLWTEQGRNNGDTTLHLGDKSIKLPPSAWVNQVQALYAQIDQTLRRLAPGIDGIFLSDRSAVLPGLNRLWPQAHSLPPEAVPGSCHLHRRLLYNAPDALSFTTRLPASRSPLTKFNTDVSAQPAAIAPTHLLWQYRAYPLQSRIFIDLSTPENQNSSIQGFESQSEETNSFNPGGNLVFRRQLTDASLCAVETSRDGTRLRLFHSGTVLLNGRTVAEGTLLKPGDELKFVQNNGKIKLISVLDTD